MANNEIGFSIKVDGVDRTVKSLEEMNQAIRDLTKEAATADFGSKNFEEITGRIQQAKAAVKEFKNDTRTKEVRDQYTDLAGGISGSFDIAEGALKSFGIESKNLAGITTSANAAINAVLQARQLQELKVDAAVALRTTTEKAAAVATKLFGKESLITNAILAANPIGLIVTALAALVIGITVAVGAIKKFGSAFKPLGDAIDFVIGKARDLASTLTFGLIDDSATAKTRENADKMITALDDVGSAANKQIADEKRKLAVMEASGAKQSDLLAQKKKINAEEVASRQAAVEQLLKIQAIDGKLDDDKKTKLAELQNEIKDLNNAALVDQASFDKEARDKAKEKAKESVNAAKEHKKEMLDQIYSTMVKTRELENQAKLDTIKNEDEKAKAALKIQQDAQREELQHTIQAFDKDQEERRKKKQAQTAEEIKYRKSLANQLSQLITTQAADMQVLEDAQAKTRLEKEKAFQAELNDIKSQGAILAISNAKDRARAELQVELDKQIAEINASELTEKQKGEKIAAVKDLNATKSKEQEDGFKQKDMEDQMSFNQWQIDQDTTSFQQKLELVDANEEILKTMTFETENQKTMALKQNADTRKAIEIAELESKVAIASAGMDVAAQAGQFLQQIAGENKAVAITGIIVEQAAAIGKIVANTAVANAKSVAAFPITGGMPWVAINTVSAGLSIASTIASAAKSISAIKSAGGGESGGGGGTSAPPAPPASKFASGGLVTGAGTGTSDSIPAMLSNGESVINANSTQMFGGLLNHINQAGGGAPIPAGNSGSNAPAPIFKTYVVASDMTSQQEADKRIKDIAKI